MRERAAGAVVPPPAAVKPSARRGFPPGRPTAGWARRGRACGPRLTGPALCWRGYHWPEATGSSPRRAGPLRAGGSGAEREGEAPRLAPGGGGWFAFGVASQKTDGFLSFRRFCHHPAPCCLNKSSLPWPLPPCAVPGVSAWGRELWVTHSRRLLTSVESAGERSQDRSPNEKTVK